MILYKETPSSSDFSDGLIPFPIINRGSSVSLMNGLNILGTGGSSPITSRITSPDWSQGVDTMWIPTSHAQVRIKELVKSLSVKDREDFLTDVLQASFDSINNNSNKPLSDMLCSWDATAEVLFDAELMADILEAKEDYERGETILWQPSTE